MLPGPLGDDDDGMFASLEASLQLREEAVRFLAPAPGKVLTPEAIRALEEAEARRVAASEAAAGQKLPTEIGGRDGEDPTRYGDYEKKGIAVDF